MGEGTLLARVPPSQPGASRTRVDRWTLEIDSAIVRLYFIETNLGTSVERGFRKRVYGKFKEMFPTSRFSEQNVGDRINNIVRHGKYVLSEDIEKLREEARTQLNWSEVPQEALGPTDEPNPEPENEVSEAVDSKSSKEYYEKLKSEFSESLPKDFADRLEALKGRHPSDRQRLTKIRTSKPVQIAIEVFNQKIFPNVVSDDTTFEALNEIIYCAAATCSAKFGDVRIKKKAALVGKKQNKKSEGPKFILRLKNRIAQFRKDISRVAEFRRGTNTPRLRQLVNSISKRFESHAGHGDENRNLAELEDSLKQRLNVLAGRLHRYENSIKRRTQNAQFVSNERIFYRNLNEGKIDQTVVRPLPSKTQLQEFWGGIWSNPANHNVGAEWIQKERDRHRDIPKMDWEGISPLEVNRVISKAHNWKAPGLDNIHNFWLKNFKSLHVHLARLFNKIIEDPESVPEYFARGHTFMLPKDLSDTENPAKYRPITCLNTLYKLLTGILADRMYAHLHRNGIMAEEQKGCCRGSRGCKEQVIIDSVVVGSSRRLHTAYIDYKKAFDSVPHSWILEIMGIYGISGEIVKFLSQIMVRWETVLLLRLNGSDSVQTEPIRIRRGIYQGDSLSPLLFCLAMNPLSGILNSFRGPKVCRSWAESCRLTHLLYMDDVKLYAISAEDLKDMLVATEGFSRDICMEFGVDKCKISVVGSHAPRRTGDERFVCESGDIIVDMEEEETYKYLGFLQARKLEHKEIKKRLTQQFVSRVTKLVKSKLIGKNLFKAFNTFAIPVLSYSFGVIKWTREELRKLRTSVSRLLTKYCMHHPKSAVERVSLPRRLGGRGLIDITHQHDLQLHKLREFFASKAAASPLHAAVLRADNCHTPLNLTNAAKHRIPLEKREVIASKQGTLIAKSLHGRHQKVLANKNVDKAASNAWLTKAGLFPETEGFMIAIQDEVIATKNYKKHIIKDRNVLNDNCRLCNNATENIQHITSSCIKLAGSDYTKRHNQVAKIVHQKLAKKVGLLKDTVPYYVYDPKTILENDEHTLYWDRTLRTDKTVQHNRPDITFVDKKSKVGYLIDIAVPNNYNLEAKITRKITNYSSLAFEFKRLNRLRRVEVIPLIISVTGVIPKCLHGYLDRIGLPSGLFLEMQKAAVLETCSLVRRFLDLPEEFGNGRVSGRAIP